MNIIKQTVSYNSLLGADASFQELEVSAENANQYVITEYDEFRIVQKPNAKNGGILLGEIYTDEYKWSKDHEQVVVTRYKLDDDEHDFEFYEIASREFAKFELTKDLWVNRNGDIEPRRSEVAI